MQNTEITELIKHPRVLDAHESVRRASGVIRASDGACALVVRNGCIAGVVTEQAIASMLSRSDDLNSALAMPIDTLVEAYPIYVNISTSMRDAARLFSENNIDMLPVVDNFCALRGVVYRKDVVGMLSQNLRPASVGGMATPLGVYLTTGSITGGAGSFGLYLTGISLGIMMVFANLIGEKLSSKLNLLAMHLLSPRSFAKISMLGVYELVSTVIIVGTMLLLLRLSPLAGFHAAEHMTVNAIEQGEDLTPEIVRRMPRVHPRCGTNLLAALSVFLLITSQFGGEMAAMGAVMVVMLGRKAIGNWMQSVFTTKPPSDHQLASGIAAGEEILNRFHQHPNRQVYGFARIWNMGFLQATAGMSTVLFVVYTIGKIFKLPILF